MARRELVGLDVARPLLGDLAGAAIGALRARETGERLLEVRGLVLRRDEIANRAREIIRKNLETVQEIACRLGENMADTEILLRSLAEGFSSGAKLIGDKDMRGRRP